MAQHHGVFLCGPGFRDPSGARLPPMQFRYGILRVFEGLRSGPFLTAPENRRRAAQLEHHFRSLCQRLVFSLQQFDALMQKLAGMYLPNEPPSLDSMRVHFESEILADHLMSYLNILVDDVAVMITQATGYSPTKPDRAVDSFGKLRWSELRPELAFQPVRVLLDQTDAVGSWWDLGFKRGSGARQLVIHNQHLVDFQLSSAPGGPMEVQAVISSPLAEVPFPCSDFFGLFRNILGGLFGWLDSAETALISHLKVIEPAWQPMRFCPCFALPVGYPLGTTHYSKEYFLVPICEGSEELPWTAEVAGPGA